jgi:FdrA protein
MTRRAIWALEAEEDVEIIAVISKPPDPAVARRLQGELLNLHKPAVVCLLGDREATFESTDPEAGPLRYVATIVDAAQIIVDSVGGKKDAGWSADPGSASMKTGKPVCGLFAGGTLMSEAQLVLDSMGAPHRLLDLGADEYTRGRAHPILDPRLRASMVAELAGRDDVGAILFDVILGDLAHPDPAGALLPALKALSPGSASVRPRTEPSRGGRRSGRPTPLQPLFAVLVGTRRDPQGLKRQRAILEKAGVQVFPSAVSAAMAAGRLVGGAP